MTTRLLVALVGLLGILAGPGMQEEKGAVGPVRKLAADRGAGVTRPKPPIFKVQKDGWPVISEAGFVQLADEGPGFYYGARVADLVKHSEEHGILDTNNWGDAEAMCYADRAVALWLEQHPEGPRLGIDEISSRYAGFPDYDGDGLSDHKTHQTGMNVNFHVPCLKRPERHIHLDVRNEELFDPKTYREMLDLLVDVGAFRMTTSSALRAVADDPELPPTRHRWKMIEQSANGYSTTWVLEDESTPVRLYLLAGRADHGDHVNVLFWRPE